MPINASHEFFEVEKKYLSAQSMDEKVFWLEEMIRKAPKHKSSENLLAELKTRLKKLKGQAEKSKKKSKGKKGIRKEGFQVLLIGKTNSGKSSLLKSITNANPKIAEYPFTTKNSEIGTMEFEGVKAQIIDMPAIGSENFDFGILNGADCLMYIIEKFEDLEGLKPLGDRNRGEKIIVFTKIDLYEDNEKRKIRERFKASRIKDFVLVSNINLEGIDELMNLILNKMQVIRVYTKEPGKEPAKHPMVLKKGSNVKEAAEKILKGLFRQIKETRVTGPSAKFVNQKVGLNHILKDRDIIEFHTR